VHYREMVDALGILLLEGQQLQGRISDNTEPITTDDVTQWVKKAATYLEEKLGAGYAARFQRTWNIRDIVHDTAGNHGVISGFVSARHAALWFFLEQGLRQLEEFMVELRD
jgi:hypothetical protein